jgi:hypothetical protein
MSARNVIAGLLLFLLACKRSTPPPTPTAEDAAAPASPSTAATASSEPKAGAMEARAMPDAKPKIEPNLLDLVPSVVAVSSAVQNPRDFPEHLVDGRIDTAWNSKTGDLVGGWIAFRVPADARVRRIEMTVGYDKVRGELDLFTANHRITKVAVSRNGKKLLEHAFDPERRTLQSIPIDGPGGDYRIEVLETKPGSKPQWRELVVSELRVIGDPGKARRTAGAPLRVVIGSLDAEPAKLDGYDWGDRYQIGPEPDLPKLCAAYLRSLDASKAEREQTAATHDLKLETPSCAEAKLSVSFTGDGTYKRLRAVRVFDGMTASTRLVVELPRGHVMLPVWWSVDDPLDPGCPSIVRVRNLHAVRVENDHLVVVLGGYRSAYTDEGRYIDVSVPGVTWCKEAGGKITCKEYQPQFQGELGVFAIAPDGTLRKQ